MVRLIFTQSERPAGPAQPGDQFWAEAHGRKFVARSVQGVFNMIDLYEEEHDLDLSSYIVHNMREYPMPIRVGGN